MNIRIKNYSRHAETCGIIWCTKECILQEVLDLLDSWNDLQQIMICQMTAIILRHVLRLHLLCLGKRMADMEKDASYMDVVERVFI